MDNSHSFGGTKTTQKIAFWKKDQESIIEKKIIWTWYVFGGEGMVIIVPGKVNLFRRMITTVFFGSKWVRKEIE